MAYFAFFNQLKTSTKEGKVMSRSKTVSLAPLLDTLGIGDQFCITFTRQVCGKPAKALLSASESFVRVSPSDVAALEHLSGHKEPIGYSISITFTVTAEVVSWMRFVQSIDGTFKEFHLVETAISVGA